MLLSSRLVLSVVILMIPCTVFAQERTPLLDFAKPHVDIAYSSMDNSMLWGRIAGSAAERASARTLRNQLDPFIDRAELHSFMFNAHRPRWWEVQIANGDTLSSAMPAPFDARFPDVAAPLPIVQIGDESDWTTVKGKWAFVRATMEVSAARTSVRTGLLYQRAVENGAAGFIFSLPTPPGVWRTIVPIDKPFAKFDERYPDGIRPIPSMSVDAADGDRLALAVADGDGLSIEYQYAEDKPREGQNVVAAIDGGGDRTVVLAAHLDSFFTGANDDASGLAVMVGLARALSEIPKDQRAVDFVFLGLSGHHDAGVGMRAIVQAYPEIMEEVDEFILLEHLDARQGSEGKKAGWPEPLNNLRRAYLGPEGWPEVEAALPELVRETGLMSGDPAIAHSCIADLYVVCGDVQPFCLIQSPPYYHTDHDTMDKLSEAGLQAAVDFHMRLLEIIGAIETE